MPDESRESRLEYLVFSLNPITFIHYYSYLEVFKDVINEKSKIEAQDLIYHKDKIIDRLHPENNREIPCY